MKAAIRIAGVSKSYGVKKALDDVTLEVQSGQILVYGQTSRVTLLLRASSW